MFASRQTIDRGRSQRFVDFARQVGGALIFFAVGVVLAMPVATNAQPIRLGVPLQTNTQSFYERIGVDFGFSLPGSQAARRGQGSGVVGLLPNGAFTPDGSLRFTQNGAGSAVPPFGGYDPGADATFGFSRRTPGGGGFHLGLRLGQGSSRTSTVTAPSLTVTNGYPGFIGSGQVRPFVTGVIPVVGGFPTNFSPLPPPGPPISPLQISLQRLQQQLASGEIYRRADGRFVDRENGSRLGNEQGLVLDGQADDRSGHAGDSTIHSRSASTAQSGDLSLAEIRRRKAARESAADEQQQTRIDELVEQADAALANRKPGAARIFLRQAAQLATGSQREALLTRMKELQ